MELIGALAAGIAIFAGLMAILPTRAQPAPGLGRRARAAYATRIGGARALLAQARLEISPRSYLALSVLAPIGFGAVGFLLSVPMAILGLIVGALVPRW